MDTDIALSPTVITTLANQVRQLPTEDRPVLREASASSPPPRTVCLSPPLAGLPPNPPRNSWTLTVTAMTSLCQWRHQRLQTLPKLPTNTYGCCSMSKHSSIHVLLTNNPTYTCSTNYLWSPPFFPIHSDYWKPLLFTVLCNCNTNGLAKFQKIVLFPAQKILRFHGTFIIKNYLYLKQVKFTILNQ